MNLPDLQIPEWLAALDEQDWQFLRRFISASGSLKDLASDYNVSYPTIRARLDRLIAKVQAADDPKIHDPFERKIRLLVADMKLPATVAKELLQAHRQALKQRNEP